MRRGNSYLSNHHMAIKSTLAVSRRWTVYMGADLGNNGSAKGHVWHKVTVHDVDLGCVSGIVSRGVFDAVRRDCT